MKLSHVPALGAALWSFVVRQSFASPGGWAATCEDQNTCIYFDIKLATPLSCGIRDCPVRVCLVFNLSVKECNRKRIQHACDNADANECPRQREEWTKESTQGRSVDVYEKKEKGGCQGKSASADVCEVLVDKDRMCQVGKPDDILYWTIKDGTERWNSLVDAKDFPRKVNVTKENSQKAEEIEIVPSCGSAIARQKCCVLADCKQNGKFERSWMLKVPNLCPKPNPPPPTQVPTTRPPSTRPIRPTQIPTGVPVSPPPSTHPTARPTFPPARIPTGAPTSPPHSTASPIFPPTRFPTGAPASPSHPTSSPIVQPTLFPTGAPASPPHPTTSPVAPPTRVPTQAPASPPQPTVSPVSTPPRFPTGDPANPPPTPPPTASPVSPPTPPPTEAPLQVGQTEMFVSAAKLVPSATRVPAKPLTKNPSSPDCQIASGTVRFDLWNGDTNKPTVVNLKSGGSYCLAENWNVRAKVRHESSSCGPVKMSLATKAGTVRHSKHEAKAPFFLFGDDSASGDVYGAKAVKPGLQLLEGATYCLNATDPLTKAMAEVCLVQHCRGPA